MTFQKGKTQESLQQWAHSHSTYGDEVVTYVLLLGAMLENKIQSGERLSEIALSTIYSTADVSAIKFGVAVHLLDEYWVYGPELMQWYKKVA